MITAKNLDSDSPSGHGPDVYEARRVGSKAMQMAVLLSQEKDLRLTIVLIAIPWCHDASLLEHDVRSSE